MTKITLAQASAVLRSARKGKTSDKQRKHLEFARSKIKPRKPTCLVSVEPCGKCKRCKNRLYQRNYRARQNKTSVA